LFNGVLLRFEADPARFPTRSSQQVPGGIHDETTRLQRVHRSRSQGRRKKGCVGCYRAAWYHKDEKGMEILLDALPIDGRIVLRANDRREESHAPVRARYPKKRLPTPERNTGKRWSR
jgi:hypothetical protein